MLVNILVVHQFRRKGFCVHDLIFLFFSQAQRRGTPLGYHASLIRANNAGHVRVSRAAENPFIMFINSNNPWRPVHRSSIRGDGNVDAVRSHNP